MAIVINLINDKEEIKIELSIRSISLGRSRKCDYRIDDKKASGEHCLLYLTDGIATIKDLDTTNGTYLNGSYVSETAIKLGDKITIGDYIELKLNTNEMTAQEKRKHLKEGFQRSKIDYKK